MRSLAACGLWVGLALGAGLSAISACSDKSSSGGSGGAGGNTEVITPDGGLSGGDAAAVDASRDATVIELPDAERLPEEEDGSAECAAVQEHAELVRRPVDLIWAIDNSGSMSSEIAAVRANMNAFASDLEAQGVDAHLVLISADSSQSNGICIDAPFGSGSCPNDSNPPHYLHVPQIVQSNDALQRIVGTFRQWYPALRRDAVTSFVVVTDDESSRDADWFQTQLAPLWAVKPFRSNNWGFHGAYCQTNCGNCANVGRVYEALRQQTDGLFADLCHLTLPNDRDAGVPDAGDPDGGIPDSGSSDGGDGGPTDAGNPDAGDGSAAVDWRDAFRSLAHVVTEQAKLSCDWTIPSTDEALDPTRVNLEFAASSGDVRTIGKVPAGESCGDRGGWRYDDESEPRRVELCPSTCAEIQADSDGAIQLVFGCKTRPRDHID